MKTYRITVFNDFADREMSGDFTATSIEAAQAEAKQYYAHSFGTIEDDIEIRKTVELMVFKDEGDFYLIRLPKTGGIKAPVSGFYEVGSLEEFTFKTKKQCEAFAKSKGFEDCSFE